MTPSAVRYDAVEESPNRTSTLVLTVAAIWAAAMGALIVLVTIQGWIGLLTFALGILPVVLVIVLVRGVIKR